MALGEAAGVLAALTARSAGASVGAEAVRSILTARGALVSLDETLPYFEDSPTA